jgi:hypothetical protein
MQVFCKLYVEFISALELPHGVSTSPYASRASIPPRVTSQFLGLLYSGQSNTGCFRD